jgi:hypothetical protein
MSIANSAVVGLLLSLGGSAAALECPTTAASQIDGAALEAVGAALDQASAGMGEQQIVRDPKVILSTGEDIPLIIRHNFLNPLRATDQILAGAYVGDYAGDVRDVFSFPDDGRLACLLTPGMQVFLTDDVTHHYATVLKVDYAGNTVTLLDPQAPASFLLDGRNLAGVAATAIEREGRLPVLQLTLAEFRSVHRGLIQWFFTEETFATIEALFPELASNPDYMFWKFGTLIGSADVVRGHMAAQDLAGVAQGGTEQRLLTLERAAGDLYFGIFQGFSNRSGGEQSFQADFPDFARDLPWRVRWTIAKFLGNSGRLDLLIPLLNAYLAVDPHDPDFRIELAARLAEGGELAGARAELATARATWRTDIKKMIDEPTEEAAVAYYLPHVDDIIAFELFRLRHAHASA